MGAPRFPPGFATGLRRFNAGSYFEAHEAFEELLDEVEGQDEAEVRWDVLVALVQAAVGYHKCASGHPGAARMLGLAAEKLAAFPPVVAGLDVAALRTRIGEDVAVASDPAALRARLAVDPPRLAMRAGTGPAR